MSTNWTFTDGLDCVETYINKTFDENNKDLIMQVGNFLVLVNEYMKNLEVSTTSIVLGILLIDKIFEKLSENNNQFNTNYTYLLSITDKVCAIAFMLALKFENDDTYPNRDFCLLFKIASDPKSENGTIVVPTLENSYLNDFNQCESTILKLLNFEIPFLSAYLIVGNLFATENTKKKTKIDMRPS